MHESQIKTRIRISTRDSDKKSTKTGKHEKTKKDTGIIRNRKEKTTQENLTKKP